MSEVYKQLDTQNDKIRRAIADPDLGSAIIESIAVGEDNPNGRKVQLRRAIRLSRMLQRYLTEELEDIDPEFAARRRENTRNAGGE